MLSIWSQAGRRAALVDLAVVYLEAEDLQAALEGLGSSQEPFDQWFRGLVMEIHGIDLAQGFPLPEQLIDFRSEPSVASQSDARSDTTASA
jgi:hypothetical protein